MPSIKIGSRNYEGIEKLNLPLSDGSGHALFNFHEAPITEIIDMTTKTYTESYRLYPNSLRGFSCGTEYLTFKEFLTFDETNVFKTLHIECGDDYRMQICVGDSTRYGYGQYYRRWVDHFECDISECTEHAVSIVVAKHDYSEWTTEEINSMIATMRVFVTTGDGDMKELIDDVPETMGQAACIARAAQFRNIKYAPVIDNPDLLAMDWSRNTYSELAGVEYQGLQYSSVRDTDKFVGFNVSFETFLTAMNNPKSVLYTKRSEIENAAMWYGINCSEFVSYCHEMPYFHVTATISKADGVEEINLEDVKIGDFLVTFSGISGHAILITGVTRDKEGNIVTIETSESGGYAARSGYQTWFGYKGIQKEYLETKGYKVYRNNNLSKISYKANKYIPLGNEPIEKIVFSDLCTDLGDKATLLTGETITLNPLVTDGYTGIKLYKDGVEVGSYSVEDITLSNLEAGKYIAKLYPEKEHSSTSFIVENAVVGRQGSRFFFSGNGDPKRILFKDKYFYTCFFVDLTEEDVMIGYKDIDLDSIPSKAVTVLVPFSNEYGFNVASAFLSDETVDYPYKILMSDLEVGELYGDGRIDSTSDANTNRIYTKNLWRIPKDGTVSVECSEGYSWIIYFFDQNQDFIGKTSFTSISTTDVFNLALNEGINIGARYFRISMRYSSGSTAQDLTGKIEEFAEKVSITILEDGGSIPEIIYPYTLAQSQFSVGKINGDGNVESSDPHRIYTTSKLPIPENGTASVSCDSNYSWIAYFFDEEYKMVGKTAFTNKSTLNVLAENLAYGTLEGAKYVRFSMRYSSGSTSQDLTGKIEEFVENVVITFHDEIPEEPVKQPYTLTSSHMTVGSVNSGGNVDTTNTQTNRIYTTDKIPLSDGVVSVNIPANSNYQWIVYFFDGSSASAACIGKSSFGGNSIDDITKVTLASGTIEGAESWRISLRDSTATYGDLSARVDEFMEAITITVTPK